MKSKTLIAVEWLWSNRGKDLWWTPAVLMAAAANPDQTAPKLTIVEANSVFRNLFEKGLIFQEVREGQLGFCLHESKIQEWNEFIKYLSMADGDLSSSAVKSDSNQQPDTKPTQKSRNKDGNDFPPTNGNHVVELGLFHFFRNVVIAGVVATGIWLIGEQFHNDGYDKIANAINFIACTVFFTVVPFEAIKHWPRRVIIWPLFVMFLCGLAFIFFGLNPEPKPFAHFTLSLTTDETPDDPVQLTNSVLIRKNWSPDVVFNLLGFLMMPLQPGKTNIVFAFGVKNDSSVTPDDLILTLTLPKDLYCVPGQGWGKVKIDSPGYILLAVPQMPNSLGHAGWVQSSPETSAQPRRSKFLRA